MVASSRLHRSAPSSPLCHVTLPAPLQLGAGSRPGIKRPAQKHLAVPLEGRLRLVPCNNPVSLAICEPGAIPPVEWWRARPHWHGRLRLLKQRTAASPVGRPSHPHAHCPCCSQSPAGGLQICRWPHYTGAARGSVQGSCARPDGTKPCSGVWTCQQGAGSWTGGLGRCLASLADACSGHNLAPCSCRWCVIWPTSSSWGMRWPVAQAGRATAAAQAAVVGPGSNPHL